MDNFDEDFLEKVKSMNRDEMEKFFLELPRERGAEYKEIFVRVEILEEIYYIVSNLPKESFKNKFNLKIKEVGGNPADVLKDYLVLEIKKFYELAHKEKRFKLPKIPDYWPSLKDIRDFRIAHPDAENKFKSNEDVEKLYRAIDHIGLDKIVEDFKEYAKTCMKIVT